MAGCFLAGATSHLFGAAAMMRSLDVVDFFLLAGAVVYLGLLLARKI